MLLFRRPLTLYHGSPDDSLVPVIDYPKPNRDFGLGFYLTPDDKLAKEWASSSGLADSANLYTYTLNISGLKVLDLCKKGPLYWIATLLRYRSFIVDGKYNSIIEKFRNAYGFVVEDYDIIKGWRADDSFFLPVMLFIRQKLDIQWVSEIIKQGGFGIQYCCKSDVALNRLNLISTESVDKEYYQKRYVLRDLDLNGFYGDYLSKHTVCDKTIKDAVGL